MNFFKNYGRHITLLVAIVLCVVASWATYAWCFYDNGIVDYKAWRDKTSIKKMFNDDWQLLYYGDMDKISIDDFNVDFMLDNRSSSQFTAQNNLILKVLRDHGKTVGFLAYYAKSPYWWHMLFLIVDKDHRKQGNAARLIQYFIDDAVQRGALKLTTFTRLVNTKARSLYEGTFKFKDIGHPEDKYLDLVLYPKKK